MFKISEITADGMKISAEKTCVIIDEKVSAFAWKMLSDKNNTVQKSYRVTVGGKCGDNDMCDSGEVFSDVSDGIAYGGKSFCHARNITLKFP